ncbi:putative bifunctional diguanylate cyclase/phosphodiesterase [Alteribacter aurantiacus]|uniref:putative bifunctional diguanylate cyclase/phosphodiesterase n=1 Tax=Alteribacter aurantiacus TaxID=254410 RepID=UPI000422308F|nr:EAL domain-containing protein [Alteribacter aurantiacus]
MQRPLQEQSVAYFIERLNQTFDSETIYMVVDESGLIQYASDSFMQLTGHHGHLVYQNNYERFVYGHESSNQVWLQGKDGSAVPYMKTSLEMNEDDVSETKLSILILQPTESAYETYSYIDDRTKAMNKRALVEVMSKYRTKPFALFIVSGMGEELSEKRKELHSDHVSTYVIGERTWACFKTGEHAEKAVLDMKEKIRASVYPYECTIIHMVNDGVIAPDDLLEKAERALEQEREGEALIEEALRSTLESDGFSLVYQPQVNLQDKTVIGVEALLRLEHETLGSIPPLTFIPIAEKRGLIKEIGYWVLNEACKQASLWRNMGIKVRMSVNVSPLQCRDKEFADRLSVILDEHRLPPRSLSLEITEGLLLFEGDHVLEEVKRLGVQLSIDDFGTGYSTLSYLKHFPVDALKIDQTFIRDVLVDGKDEAIVTSLIDLAKRVGINVIAEGVETEDVLAFLKENHCNEMQGYLYCKPLPPEQVVHYFGQDCCDQLFSE